MSGRVVLVSEELFEQFVRDGMTTVNSDAHIDYGEPDEHGYYTPTVTRTFADIDGTEDTMRMVSAGVVPVS
jgi:hypothetical protein